MQVFAVPEGVQVVEHPDPDAHSYIAPGYVVFFEPPMSTEGLEPVSWRTRDERDALTAAMRRVSRVGEFDSGRKRAYDRLTAETEDERKAELVEGVYAEVERRIYAVVDEFAQTNLTAAVAYDATLPPDHRVLSQAQIGMYGQGLAWIAEMRATATTLVQHGDTDYASDDKWPAVPPGLRELAAAF